MAVLSETPTEELEPCKHARQPEIRRPPLHPPPRSHRSVRPCWKASARASSSSTRMVGCCTPTNGPVASSTRSTGTAERERQAILDTLESTHGKLAETARRLGISRTTLWRRLRAYGLRPNGHGGRGTAPRT